MHIAKRFPSLLSLDKSSFSILQYAGIVLADKPVAYYRFGEVQGATAVDSSGKRHTGTYENGPVLGVTGLVLDAANTAVNFAATGDVVIPDAADLNFVNAPFTIEAWVNGPYSSFVGERRIFDKGIAGGPGGYGLDLNSNVQRIFGCTNFDTLTHLQDNTTYHVVGVADGAGNASIYINGQLAGSGAFSSCQPYTGSAHIALDNEGSSHFDGTIDEVAVYNYALSAGRIRAHYQRGTGH
jgi:Concanavalin A-like lectin/glucanases superfamily